METTFIEQPIEVRESKKCPFCAEQIHVEAIKCRFCGEFLDRQRPSRPSKWYFSTSTLITAVLFLGPLALPLVWLNPRYKHVTKVVISVAVIGLTVALFYLMIDTYRQVTEQIRALGIG